jgi:hypothetical protein
MIESHQSPYLIRELHFEPEKRRWIIIITVKLGFQLYITFFGKKTSQKQAVATL